MRGFGAAAAWRLEAIELLGGAVPLLIEAVPQPGDVGPAQELLHGQNLLVGIAEAGVAIAVGQVHRLHQGVHRGGAVQALMLKRQRLQDRQQLQQGHTTATGGRHRQHGMAAEAADQRRHQLGVIGVEIGLGDQATTLHHQLHQGLCHRAAIEAPLPLTGNPAQAGGQ